MSTQPQSSKDLEKGSFAKLQYKAIDTMYLTNKGAITWRGNFKELLQQAVTMGDKVVDGFDLPDSIKVGLKTQSSQMGGLRILIFLVAADTLVLVEWETKFKADWKVEKKASVAERQVWLEDKSKELAKHNDTFVAGLRKAAKDAGYPIEQVEIEKGTAALVPPNENGGEA
jgi:hypothetical protein